MNFHRICENCQNQIKKYPCPICRFLPRHIFGTEGPIETIVDTSTLLLTSETPESNISNQSNYSGSSSLHKSNDSSLTQTTTMSLPITKQQNGTEETISTLSTTPIKIPSSQVDSTNMLKDMGLDFLGLSPPI